MKEKISIEAKYDALTQEQKESLNKVCKLQWICLGGLFVLFLCVIAAAYISLMQIDKNPGGAIRTGALILIIGSVICIAAYIAIELIFKKKFPYYSDKLYKHHKKSK